MTSKEIITKIADLKKLIQEGNKALALVGAAGSEQERAREAEQELLDCINYCVFQIMRLRRLKRQ